MYVIQSDCYKNMTRYDAGPDFSYAPSCTQFLSCVTECFMVRGKAHCAFLAKQRESGVFVYKKTTAECQVCPLSIASIPGSTIPGSHNAYIEGQCKAILNLR